MPTMLLRTAIATSAPRLRARTALGLDRAQHLLRRNRQIVDTDADSVEDGVRNGRQYRIRAHFAGALGAEGTIGSGAFQHGDVVGADVARTRHDIFDEVARAVDRVGIIGFGRLVERVTDAHPGAANELLLDQARVERAAELVGRVHADHRDLAGLVVDLNLGDKTGMGVAGRRRHLAGLGIDIGQRNEKDATAGDGLALLELRGDGDVFGGDRAVRRALDVDVATPVGFEIGGVDLEFLGGALHHHAARLARRRHHGIADAMGAARSERAHAMRAGVGIGGVDVAVLDGYAERLCADLPRDRLHALAEIDRG